MITYTDTMRGGKDNANPNAIAILLVMVVVLSSYIPGQDEAVGGGGVEDVQRNYSCYLVHSMAIACVV